MSTARISSSPSGSLTHLSLRRRRPRAPQGERNLCQMLTQRRNEVSLKLAAAVGSFRRRTAIPAAICVLALVAALAADGFAYRAKWRKPFITAAYLEGGLDAQDGTAVTCRPVKDEGTGLYFTIWCKGHYYGRRFTLQAFKVPHGYYEVIYCVGRKCGIKKHKLEHRDW